MNSLGFAPLVEKYGSWVRVQVAFYDFLFQTATKLCAKRWKEMAITEAQDGFCDGANFYERSVKAIEETFETPNEAWGAFVKQEMAE